MSEASKEWEDLEAQLKWSEAKRGKWPRQESSLKEKKKLPFALNKKEG
jgi:hypothetical protein